MLMNGCVMFCVDRNMDRIVQKRKIEEEIHKLTSEKEIDPSKRRVSKNTKRSE